MPNHTCHSRLVNSGTKQEAASKTNNIANIPSPQHRNDAAQKCTSWTLTPVNCTRTLQQEKILSPTLWELKGALRSCWPLAAAWDDLYRHWVLFSLCVFQCFLPQQPHYSTDPQPRTGEGCINTTKKTTKNNTFVVRNIAPKLYYVYVYYKM